MKKGLLLSLAFVCSTAVTFAQGEFEAFKMSKTDLKGTARSVSMGGAFGALGGDISGVAINPAGIGVYTGSEIVTTMNFRNNSIKSTLTGNSSTEDRFKFSFDNLGFVTTLPLFSDAVPKLNIGFSYNKLKSFDRLVSTKGTGFRKGSLTDYMAHRASTSGSTSFGLEQGNQAWQHDWMGVLGYNSFLINQIDEHNFVSSIGGDNMVMDNALRLKEKGYINSYDFTVGTTISDILSIGFTASITDIDYSLNSYYQESFTEGNYQGDFSLKDEISTDGTGYQVSVGAILKPIDEIRIGIAYHSPTWYKMEDVYYAKVDHNLTSLLNASGQEIDPTNYESGYVDPDGPYRKEYEFTSPGKWTFSLASIIASKAIISVDYDLIDYKQMKLHDYYWDDYSIANSGVNKRFKQNFKLSSTLRIGAEYRFTPQFSARAGYSWVQSPLEKNFKANKVEAYTAGTSSAFILEGDTQYITWGLGYRFTKNFYTDIAFVYRQQKDDLYAFTNTYDNNGTRMIESIPAKLKTTGFQGLLTLGVKF